MGDPDPRLRLFLFSHAGGGTNSWRGFREGLPPAIELCAVRLPGREERLSEPPFRRMEPLVDALSVALTAVLDRPFAFFGHSMGALVALALARRLRDQAAPLPVDFVASGYSAPSAIRRRPRPLYQLPRAELIAELRLMGGTPPQVLDEPDLLDLLLPTLRADLEVSETWAAPGAPPLPTPILAAAGTEDASVSDEGLEAWRYETSQRFAWERFTGDHFYSLPGQRALLHQLTVRLSAAARRPP
jgi:medium-chain acyl-[acyl-carrier-protein] hydrolase